MRLYLLLFVLLLSPFFGKTQQDLQIIFVGPWTYPQSGCDVGGNADQLQLAVRNGSVSSTTFGVQIYLYFQVDGGAIVVDSIPALGPNATWQFNFVNNPYDFSACDDTFDIVTWVSYANDPNNTNDTLAYQFINSCTITPGDITGGLTVCQTGNTGTLTHGNYTNGWVQDWEYWDANVGAWTSAGNPYSNTYTFNNLLYETYYRVIRTSAYCPNDTSTYDTVYVDSASIAGWTTGDVTVCSGSNGGWIYSNGVYGNLDDWEFNNSGTWASMGAADSVQYSNLTQTTMYRYLVTNGVCPQDTSDTAYVTVDFNPVGGILWQDDTLCSGPNSDTLFLSGYSGTIVDWYIDSTGTWTSLGVTDTFLIISNMTTTSQFMVELANGVCPNDTSNWITMVIQNAPAIVMCADTAIVIGDTAQICASGGAAWVWSPGITLNDSLLQNPLAFPTVTTDYVYYAMSTNGCMNWDTLTVTVLPPVPPQDSIVITNLITANGDGINDTWAITDVNLLPGTQVKVWNLYGQEVYTNDSYQNDWDGSYKGGKLPNGTYFYWVRLGVYDSEHKGTVTIAGDE
ncbi:MAG: gliding motility-associated C-terminal domain-containing protein [Crocinitomicaceae bacterium]|nr:gliding motility-associated C-terminal domain-containing protein [Crocinitomicaceae bacterium]